MSSNMANEISQYLHITNDRQESNLGDNAFAFLSINDKQMFILWLIGIISIVVRENEIKPDVILFNINIPPVGLNIIFDILHLF